MTDSEFCINESMPRLKWQTARVGYANDHRTIYKTTVFQMIGKEKRGGLFAFGVIAIELS